MSVFWFVLKSVELTGSSSRSSGRVEALCFLDTWAWVRSRGDPHWGFAYFVLRKNVEVNLGFLKLLWLKENGLLWTLGRSLKFPGNENK